MIYGDDDDGGGDEDICLTLNVRIVMTMPLYGSIICNETIKNNIKVSCDEFLARIFLKFEKKIC